MSFANTSALGEFSDVVPRESVGLLLCSCLSAWVPKYGNYGGPAWTGGDRVRAGLAPDFGVPPIDKLDAAYREHDFAYFKTRTDPNLTRFDRFARTVQADLILIGSIDCLRQIERPSLSFGALMYAALTQVVFARKLSAYRWALIMAAKIGKAIAAAINWGMNHLASMNPRLRVRARQSTYGAARLPPRHRQRAD